MADTLHCLVHPLKLINIAPFDSCTFSVAQSPPPPSTNHTYPFTAFTKACELFNEEVKERGLKVAGFRQGAKLPPAYLYQMFGEDKVMYSLIV